MLLDLLNVQRSLYHEQTYSHFSQLIHFMTFAFFSEYPMRCRTRRILCLGILIWSSWIVFISFIRIVKRRKETPSRLHSFIRIKFYLPHDKTVNHSLVDGNDIPLCTYIFNRSLWFYHMIFKRILRISLKIKLHRPISLWNTPLQRTYWHIYHDKSIFWYFLSMDLYEYMRMWACVKKLLYFNTFNMVIWKSHYFNSTYSTALDLLWIDTENIYTLYKTI